MPVDKFDSYGAPTGPKRVALNLLSNAPGFNINLGSKKELLPTFPRTSRRWRRRWLTALPRDLAPDVDERRNIDVDRAPLSKAEHAYKPLPEFEWHGFMGFNSHTLVDDRARIELDL